MPRSIRTKTIGWKDAGTQVWAAIWRDALKEAGNRLDGITPAHVAALDTPAAAVRLGYAPRRELADANAGGMAMHTLGCALSVALIDQGWVVSALPGEVVVLSKGEASMAPFADLARLTRKELTPDDWKKMWGKLGLLELDFATLRAKTSPAAFLEPFGLLVGQLAYTQEMGPELAYQFLRFTNDDAQVPNGGRS